MIYSSELPKDYPFTEEEVENIVDNFMHLYQRYRRKKHPTIPRWTYQKIIERLPTDGKTFFRYDDYFPMMLKYFQTDFKGYQCDYKLSHFLSGTIRTNRLREVEEDREKRRSESEWQ